MVDLEASTTKLNGTFYRDKDGGSIARQQPNPEVDAVWDEWELTRMFPITKADVIKMGKDPSTVRKLENDVWDDAYAAIFDVYHHIHCLNSLRHIVYGDYCKLVGLSLKYGTSMLRGC